MWKVAWEVCCYLLLVYCWMGAMLAAMAAVAWLIHLGWMLLVMGMAR